MRSLKYSVAALIAALAVVVTGCSTLDRAYQDEVAWMSAPTVHVVTNMVVVTNTVPVVTERTNVVFVTNEVSRAVHAVAVREPIATNMVTVIATNLVPVFWTNLVEVPVTNLVARPEALATIGATGDMVNAFAPGLGTVLALALGGLYHAYRQLRNRQVNAALVQGVETARAVLATTPQGQAADAQLVKWLMEHQKEAGVFTTVSELVEQLTDNPAARLTAQEIRERVERAGVKAI